MHTALDVMGGTMTGSAFTTELLEHVFTMRYAMTALTLGKLAVMRMTEGTGQFCVTSFTRYQCLVLLGVTTAADGLGISGGKGHIKRIMRIGMTTQTISTLQILAVTLMVMAFEAGRNLAVPNMTFSAGEQFEMLGIGLFQGSVYLGMARIHMAVAAIFFGRIRRIRNLQRFMRTNMTAQTNLVSRFTGNMIYLAAILAMTHGAVRNIAVLSVTVGTV